MLLTLTGCRTVIYSSVGAVSLAPDGNDKIAFEAVQTSCRMTLPEPQTVKSQRLLFVTDISGAVTDCSPGREPQEKLYTRAIALHGDSLTAEIQLYLSG